jgi:hypothetical protein
MDHFVVLGEAHLRRILRAYAGYYNDIRTHRSLDKDATAAGQLGHNRPGVQSDGPAKRYPTDYPTSPRGSLAVLFLQLGR